MTPGRSGLFEAGDVVPEHRDAGVEMIELFARVNRDGTTIIVVTHDEDLARAAKRVVHMRDGLVVDDHRQDGGA